MKNIGRQRYLLLDTANSKKVVTSKGQITMRLVKEICEEIWFTISFNTSLALYSYIKIIQYTIKKLYNNCR